MMVILSKLVALFLPPLLFAWPMLAAAFLRLRRLLLFFAMLLLFLSSRFGADMLIEPLENATFPAAHSAPKYVVVLGGGYDRGDLPLTSWASERLLKALIIAHKEHLPLVYSGYEAPYAAKEIEYIQKGFGLNVPVLLESKSLNTVQNGAFTAKLLGHVPIYLVTTAAHMPRAYAIFRHFGFDVIPVKADFKTKKEGSFWENFRFMDNLHNSYFAIHEYLGLLSLWLRGITPNPKAP